MAEQRTYFAMSVFNSRTMWLNTIALLVAVLSMSEVLVLIPPAYLPIYTMVTAVLNMILRTQTVRPVAFTSPGSVTATQVDKIDPPAKKISD